MFDPDMLAAAAGCLGLILTAFLLTVREFNRMPERRVARARARVPARDHGRVMRVADPRAR